jgi:alkylation response protein AidB-like acyl-CoA dehydrogenase
VRFSAASRIRFDESDWKTNALIETHTATATFTQVPIAPDQIIGQLGWYLNRLGFWRGAIGPAACWAGGAEGLVDYAARQTRHDPHTIAHFGAMNASVWALRSYLESAGREIDEDTNTFARARTLALTVRHLVEQSCTDILRRLTRAHGPHPLVSDSEVSRRYQDLDLYLRQSHAERDLETLGRALRES